MADTTNIAWTDSTFNPWIGCTKVSPGCDHCYAEALMDKRWGKVKWGAGNPRQRTSASNWAQPLKWQAKHAEFEWEHGHRRRVFCASLADVFDIEAPFEWRSDLFGLIADTPDLDWLLLTKRIGNVQNLLPDLTTLTTYLPRNIWLGATVVNQEEYDRDVPKLVRIPAAVRFLSIEPMLGPIKFSPAIAAIDWVIVGGESGAQARPMQHEWVRSIWHQCAAWGIAMFFKQWGGIRPAANGCLLDGQEIKQWPST